MTEFEKEKQLILKARSGCEESLLVLYEKYKPILISCALKYAKNSFLTFDEFMAIGKEQFMRCVHTHNFSGWFGCYIKPFIRTYSIKAINTREQFHHGTWGKRNKKDVTLISLNNNSFCENEDEFSYTVGDDDSGFKDIEEKEILKFIYEEISKLSFKEQIVIELSLQNHLNIYIAKIINMTPAGVGVIKKRAIKKLQEKIYEF